MRATGFTITRILDAPRELVFQAWTDPDQLHWFLSDLPQEAHPINVDLRPGGAWTLNMVVGENDEYTTGGVYLEIVPVEKLSFTWGAHGGWPSLRDGLVATVTLNELGDKTEMLFELAVPEGASTHPAMQLGWADTIDRLVARFTRE